ncbi:exonuclease domain-containing protein [Promicromonospora sukumoe]|uniref:3'-5' exonuclease n=1 Tax=Promicromonospora sukumoe TaxID=88382 RepID=UPI0037C561E1
MSATTRWDEVDYVVVDVEGNGARPPDLVEVATVPVRGGVVGQPRVWLVRPPAAITWQARKIHGISNDDVANAPTIGTVAAEITAALGDAIPVGHAVHVDLDVLHRSLPTWDHPTALDTLKLARRAFDLESYKLAALVEHRHLGADLPAGMRAHRADYDALITARLFVDLASGFAPGGAALDDLINAASSGKRGGAKPAAEDEAATLFELP